MFQDMVLIRTTTEALVTAGKNIKKRLLFEIAITPDAIVNACNRNIAIKA